MTLLFWLSITVLCLNLAISLEIILGIRQLTELKNIPPAAPEQIPKVSIIIPACNEASTIEPALRSVLAIDYPELEIIVINDRSTDNTGELLEEMKARHPRLQVQHISELPAGWMGKSHALNFGADQAQGEYLLFTDADILFEKTTLARAMGHVLANHLDHLSIIFENLTAGGLMNAGFIDGCGGLLLLFKPWKAKDPKSKNFMGVGAFNLVKKEAYKKIGGHSTLSMHPIDDIMLGKVIKDQGFAQDCVIGQGFVQVKWYNSVAEMVNGVMKNVFAAYNFRASLVLLSVGLIFLLNILPLWAIFFTSGASRVIWASIVAGRLLAFAVGFKQLGQNPLNAFWSLVSPYLSIYIAMKAMVTTLKNGGITWRGTFYSLKELKANRF